MLYKIKKSLLFVVFTLLWTVAAQAQEYFTVSGTIQDKKSGETLIGASISLQNSPGTGTTTNEYGFYSLQLPKGPQSLVISYVGYNTFVATLDMVKSTVLNVEMDDSVLLNEVVITGERQDDNLTKPEMGVEKLNMADIAKIPVLFGEKDVLKTIQLLPGIKSTGEGSSGFSVRGGATDQNLILLDEAPVYNASHLLGFFSTFNSDAIKDATIIKGNSPAQYGGRLSSVLDVKMKEGNYKDYSVSGGLGLISSKINIEGPIQNDKSSFIISGRRTYADLFLKLTEDFKDSRLYFYDLNAKANYKINDKNRVFLSGYFGRDVLGFGDNLGIDWGNATGTLRWNSILNEKLFSNTSLIYSNYDYNIGITSGDTEFNINSNIKDWNLKQDFSYFANPKNSMRFGFQAIHHTITPSSFSGTVNSNEPQVGRKAWENAIYLNNVYKPNEKWSIDYGLRASAYTIMGGDTYNIYENGLKTDSVVLASGEVGKTYFTLEPRLTLNYRLSETKSLKAGYARNTQHLHLLSNSSSGNPTDQWIGNSYNIKPELADQISLGYSQNFKDNAYEFGIETYYKSMQNQVDYKDGADLQTAADVESELLFGKGRAYGLEMILKKKSGNFTGWVSYTLSKTERKIDGINNNEWYNARQDRTHDISVVGSYQLNKKWSLSGVFVYNTGNAVTFPTGKYSLNGNTIYQYGSRNADRMPANHRLDISATYDFKKKGKYESSLNFGIYNLYGRENAYTITFRDNEDDPSKTEAVQTSLFKWVPSVSYNFKF
jgi:TonB dependent receptor/CarboxypepD_reg-like domain/TonB-dependent Receptor Plug Domain